MCDNNSGLKAKAMKAVHRSLVVPILVAAISIIVVQSFCPLTQHSGRQAMAYHVSVEDDDGQNAADALSSCPFSMKFPRYRINLTRSNTGSNNRKRNNNSKNDASKQKFFCLPSLPWQSPGFQRNRLEKLLRPGEALRIRQDVDGIEALACLWEEAAMILEDSDGDNKESSSSVLVALPRASFSVVLVQNFVEIVDWMTTNFDDTRYSGGIRAELVQEGGLDLPVVRLERTRLKSKRIRRDSTRSDTTDEDAINNRTRHWVRRVLVDLGICPFTRSDRMSGQGLADLGVPVGSIAYQSSDAIHPVTLFADTWRAIAQMIAAGPEGREGVSSILLAAPAFDDDFEVWAGPIFTMLEASVVAAQAEADVGVVCFHPRYATPDGSTFPGFGHMHSVPRLAKWYGDYWAGQVSAMKTATSAEEGTATVTAATRSLTIEQVAAGGAWQRRTPHATINVLRADQLAVAESRRESETLYAENIERLVGASGIGSEQLSLDLDEERRSREI